MERLRLYRTSHVGTGHEHEIKGRHLVATVKGSKLTVRVHGKRGRLVNVQTFTRVDWVDWKPGK